MHSHDPAVVSRKLLIATIATALFVVIEMIAGVAASSLALVGAALHNFTDTLALLLALVAVRVARRPANAAKTYGYHRAGVLAAFINSGTLAAFTIYLFYEAVHRLRVPHAVDSRAMLVVAAAAFVLNAAIPWWLRDHSHDDLNVRSAVLHMLGDAASSVGIVIAPLLLARTGRPFWDPPVPILIGILIPWSIVARGPARRRQAAPIISGDVPLKSMPQLLARVNELLHAEYPIEHTTIQFE